MEEFTVKKFIKKMFMVNNKMVEYQGYSFHDKYGGTMIIAYGKNRRDFLIKKYKKKLPYKVTKN